MRSSPSGRSSTRREHLSPPARGRGGNQVSPTRPLSREGVGNLSVPHTPPRSRGREHRVSTVASALPRTRGRVPTAVFVAIAVAWGVAVVAELTGAAHTLHHDALIEGG